MTEPLCFLARHGVYEHGGMCPCDGRLIRAHLIPQQVLKRAQRQPRIGFDPWDPRLWVWACGGICGNAGHHGMLDTARTIRLPRDVLPAVLEDAAAELGLGWWLCKVYGCGERCDHEEAA